MERLEGLPTCAQSKVEGQEGMLSDESWKGG